VYCVHYRVSSQSYTESMHFVIVMLFIVTDIRIEIEGSGYAGRWWKWLSCGSRKLPTKEPRYRQTLYFYHGQDGEERNFKRYVYQCLDDEEYILIYFTVKLDANTGRDQFWQVKIRVPVKKQTSEFLLCYPAILLPGMPVFHEIFFKIFDAYLQVAQ